MTQIKTDIGAVEVNHHADGRVHVTVWCGIQENGTGIYLTKAQAGELADAIYPLIPIKTGNEPPFKPDNSGVILGCGCKSHIPVHVHVPAPTDPPVGAEWDASYWRTDTPGPANTNPGC